MTSPSTAQPEEPRPGKTGDGDDVETSSAAVRQLRRALRGESQREGSPVMSGASYEIVTAPLDHVSTLPDTTPSASPPNEEAVEVGAGSVSGSGSDVDVDGEMFLAGWEDAATNLPDNHGRMGQTAAHLATGIMEAATDLNHRLTGWVQAAFPAMAPTGASTSVTFDEGDVEDGHREGEGEMEDGVRGKVCWVLGQRYGPYAPGGPLPLALRRDLQSRIHCTYRTDFAPIRGTDMTNDVGWGCMMRTGQSLLAQALLLRHLGRDWRLGPEGGPGMDVHREIISWFADTPEAPFSLHRIALQGEVGHGKKVGAWHGPHTIAMVLRDLVAEKPEAGLRVQVTSGDTVYRDQVEGCARDEDGTWQPLLLLVVVMLGARTVPPAYLPGLRVMLTFEESVGIAGGRPDASLYFIGFEGEEMLYLDPHRAKRSHGAGLSREHLTSYHGEDVRRITGDRLDPCALLGFYLEDEEDLGKLARQMHEVSRKGKAAFTIVESTPRYSETQDFDTVSDAEFELS